MAIDLNTLFTSLGIVSGNTQSKNQYEFYNGIVWDDATITYNQKEFFDKVGLSRYDFFKQYGDERSFYDNVDDTRITNMRNFYQYAGEYLAGADPQIPATAGFSADATQSTANTVITFTNTSTGTSPITYAWDFGDGGTSTDTNPTHSYSATGSYTITLTASNAFGTDDEVKTGYIQIGDLVVASFSSSTYSTTPDTVITFTDTSTGNPTSWAWDFGDGNIDVTQNPTHSYSATGSYVVTMTASSVYDTDSTSDVIEVVEAAPSFTATGGTTASYTDGGTTYMVHTFTSSGDLVVTGEGQIDFLIVAGGQAGSGASSGSSHGGGGGAGGEVYYTTGYTASTNTYSIIVGNGGAPGSFGALGPVGGDSVAFGITTRGGNRDRNGNNINVLTNTTGGGTYYQVLDVNYFGGNGYTLTYARGGNGAGARGNGVNSTSEQSNGFTSDITGSSLMYGCGANGGVKAGSGVGPGAFPTNGQGRDGGTANGSDATANRGGGGGGGGYTSPTSTKGGAGGSGVVIIRYAIS